MRSVLWGAVALTACGGKSVDLGGDPRTGSGGAGAGAAGDGAIGGENSGSAGKGGAAGARILPNAPGGLTQSSKVDLLLVIDNSISMADKQDVLKKTVADLVERLTSSSVTDLHVAVITSSLGDHGQGQTCVGNDALGGSDEQQDDHAHLITTRPRGANLGLPQVITWDSTQDTAVLTRQIQAAVGAVGEFGCGLESQLESMYRFLSDPAPSQAVQKDKCPNDPSQLCAHPAGIDTELLSQRQAFLRSDSAVAVVLLTDENDCSIRETQQYYYAADQNLRLPKGSSACALDPNSPCCYPCTGNSPAGCTPKALDPACSAGGVTSSAEDSVNLRCFHQKERFGIDFLYPVQRYVTALTRTQLCTSSPDLVPTITCLDADRDGKPDLVTNPLFAGPAGATRDPSMVYLLGIVGVPWQDLATGGPAALELQYKAPAALAVDGTWGALVGDPTASPTVPPADALMIESVEPRAGQNSAGAFLPGPTSPIGENNAMNGHEWTNAQKEDLQYACIFPLVTPRDCQALERQTPQPGCDCGRDFKPEDFNPLCQDPRTGKYAQQQYFGKAYPATRELSVLKALGEQGLTASVCAPNLTDTARGDYGYRPAIDLLATQLKRSVR